MAVINKQFNCNGYWYEVSFNPNAKRQSIDVAGKQRVAAIAYCKEKKQILIVGAGWYGCHTALALKEEHPEWDIYIYEKEKEIFGGISGEFGIRLHAGPHYPRSAKTREDCHKGFTQFSKKYPKLLVPLENAIYAVGTTDADGNPSKVTKEEFEAVCKEFGNARKVPWKKMGYYNLNAAYTIEEPCIALREPLLFFKERFKRAGVKVKSETTVTKFEKKGESSISVTSVKGGKEKKRVFNVVVNATSFQALLPPGPDLPLNIEVVYQVCVGLVYERRLPGKPFSFIVMDGWFPCLMPYDDRINKSKPIAKYILTHGKYTLHTFKTAKEAHVFLAGMEDAYVKKVVKKKCEAEMGRFYLNFPQEFKFIGWKGAVLAKAITETEFRSGFTYQCLKSRVIQVFPGKVSNVIAVEKEIKQLIKGEPVVKEGQYVYAKNGVLDQARNEISEKPNGVKGNTSELKSFNDYTLYKKTSKQTAFWKKNLRPYFPKVFLPSEGINPMVN